jgi:hypothetical protein
MNEFETDLEKPYKPEGGWISCSSCPVERSMLEAMNGTSNAMERGRDFHSAVAKRVGNEKKAGKVALHKNSYPKILAGISAGTLLGFVIASMFNGRSG